MDLDLKKPQDVASDMHLIDARTRDLTSEVFAPDGSFRLLPADYWRGTSQAERSLLCVRNAMYVIPTVELCEHLRFLIKGRKAIEIGSGNGILARALGIPATDNRMQEMPKYQAAYSFMKQPTITYGDNVEHLDARKAIAKHKPEVVVAAWVTHKYDPRRHEAGGNEIGVVEEDVIDSVDTYILVGNTQVHRGKSIWARPHEIEHPDYVFSRAMNPTRDFIAVWNKGF